MRVVLVIKEARGDVGNERGRVLLKDKGPAIFFVLALCRVLMCFIIEGSLEVKLPTIWTDEKQSREEAERRGRLEESRRERVRRKKMQMREKVGKSRNTVFFQLFVAPEGRKVGSLKRRVRSQLAR